jgi:oligopeptide transport system permease protein
MPVITILGPLTAALVTGSFVIEYLFSIPGMGRHFVTAVVDRDYPLIMGVTLVYTTVIVTANMIVDILYGILDPRVRR